MRTIESWVRALDPDTMRWMYDIPEMVSMHQELHAQFGDSPSEAIIPGEQRLSEMLRSLGVEHRYEDKLSKDAGTFVESPADPTMDEVRVYIDREIVLLSGAVALVQDAGDGGQIYLKVDSDLLGDTTAKAILKMINRWLPTALQLKPMPRASKGEFATVSPTHALELSPRYGRREVTLWSSLTKKLRDSAAEASAVFKRSADPKVKLSLIDVCKAATDEEWHFVLGEVLIPEEPDRTKTEESVADVYDAVEVEKACHWFAANSQSYEYMHEDCGGYSLDSSEILMVENYIQRADVTINKNAIKSGTWIMGAYVRGHVWAAIEKGDLNIWSISAKAMASFEEAPQDAS